MTLKKYYPWGLFAIYEVIVLFAIPSFISPFFRISFFLYATVIYGIVVFPSTHAVGVTTPNLKDWLFWNTLFVGSLILLVALRLAPFFQHGETPLGYDTGFYWQYFNLFQGLGKIGLSVGTNHIAYVLWFPFQALGFSALPTIHFLHIIHQLLTAGAVYFLLRSLPVSQSTKRLGIIGIFLFALSLNQFMAFWWMFYKQSMAIPFLIIALGLFLRGSWLAIPLAMFGSAVHIYPAIPFVLSLATFLLIHIGKNLYRHKPLEPWVRSLLWSSILGAIALLIFKGPTDIMAHLYYVSYFKGFATGGQSFEVAQAKGLFIPFSTFLLNTMFYLPFALIGLLHPKRWLFSQSSVERLGILPLIFVFTLILGTFPFLYENRALILLDILVIVFAAMPLVNFLEVSLATPSGRVMVGLFLATSVFFTSGFVLNNKPQITIAEAHELQQLRTSIRKPDDYVMATSSLYTPWVFAYTGFEPTIAPGWLSLDKWDLKMWQDFWGGTNDNRRIQLLQIYEDRVIYMFVGDRQTVDENLKKFLETNPHITKLSPHIWRYSPVLTPKLPSL